MQRVFGGQVLAQSIIAAGRTVADVSPSRAIHSLHAYFVQGGTPEEPIDLVVERVRVGAASDPTNES